MKKLIPPFLLLFFLYNAHTPLHASGEETCRVWQQFITAQKTHRPTTLLDFSFAGYRHSEVSVPEVKHRVFNVCDYGAIPNDHQSDRGAVIKAIAAAQANGSGVIYFPKGRFLLHSKFEPSKPIFIKNSHIVLRGEGAGAEGTEIFMETPNRPVNPDEKWTSPTLFCFTGGGHAALLTHVTGNAAKGSFSIKVKEPSMLKAGQWVCLRLNNNTPQMIAKELAPYTVEEDWTSLHINGVQVNDYHLITSIKGNQITFKEPIMHPVEAQDGWMIQSFPHIEEVGVEQIAFVGNWKEPFVHHKDWLHDGGYKFIEYRNVANSWIRACRFTDMSDAAAINSSANVSIYDCVVTGNLGHNSFHSQGASRVFMGGIDDQPSQWHSVGVAKPALGTVIWRVQTKANSCFESHASQPRATLFDACEGGFMRGRSGGAIMNAPNHLHDLVFWNYKELDEGTKEMEFWPTDTRWFKFMPPILVGFHGAGTTFKASQVAYEESNGQPVEPESLFEAQLKLRLGHLPAWLVALKEQVKNKQYSGALQAPDTLSIGNVTQLKQAALNAKAGDVLLLEAGEYMDVTLKINASGTFTAPILVQAKQPGKTLFSGKTKVELNGHHITVSGISFNNSLLTLTGSHCRISQCLFTATTEVKQPYISTVRNPEGVAPQYACIDHCSFMGKGAGEEMVTLEGDAQRPMYHKVENCYFTNPKQEGHTAGAIRLTTAHLGEGRCLITNNLFERQDADVITSQSAENVFFKNSFINCRGTLNLEEANRQVVLNNFFLATDKQHPYGGMSVSGHQHLIGCNMFKLPRTLAENESAAIRFKDNASTTASASARPTSLLRNVFVDTDRYSLYLSNTAIGLVGNLFVAEASPQSAVMQPQHPTNSGQMWEQNFYNGIVTGADHPINGLEQGTLSLRYDDSKINVEDQKDIKNALILRYIPFKSVEGIDLNFLETLRYGCCGSPLWRHAVGTGW